MRIEYNLKEGGNMLLRYFHMFDKSLPTRIDFGSWSALGWVEKMVGAATSPSFFSVDNISLRWPRVNFSAALGLKNMILHIFGKINSTLPFSIQDSFNVSVQDQCFNTRPQHNDWGFQNRGSVSFLLALGLDTRHLHVSLQVGWWTAWSAQKFGSA